MSCQRMLAGALVLGLMAGCVSQPAVRAGAWGERRAAVSINSCSSMDSVMGGAMAMRRTRRDREKKSMAHALQRPGAAVRDVVAPGALAPRHLPRSVGTPGPRMPRFSGPPERARAPCAPPVQSPARLPDCSAPETHAFQRSDQLNVEQEVLRVLDQVLSLNGRAASFTRDTALLGAIPELDSMAVVSLITSLEEQFGIAVDDDDISADTFVTVGALADFVSERLG